MAMSQHADSLEFAGDMGVLRRRWWIVLVLTCLGVLAAGAYIKVAPKAYTATASVNVTATGISQTQGGAVAGGGPTVRSTSTPRRRSSNRPAWRISRPAPCTPR